MATIVITVKVEWDEETEGPAKEFLATITDPTAEVVTSGYSLSGPATYSVKEADMDAVTIADLAPGDRVEMAPHTDEWMSGDRYAIVESISPMMATLVFERSGRRGRHHPSNIARNTRPLPTEET